jgi:2-iminobutanoate/2-iminopropanoate deaminase
MKYASALLVGILALALTAGSAPEKAKERRYFKNEAAASAQLPFSDGVLAGDTFDVAGHIGHDLETMRPPDDPKEEARLLLDRIKATLARAGLTMDDLVYVTVYCTDLSLYDDFNKVYRTYFAEEFPARAFVGSGPLLFGAHFEVQAIAVKR